MTATLLGVWTVAVAGCAKAPVSAISHLPLVSSFLAPAQPEIVFLERFQQLDPQRWHEVEVRGKTMYTLDEQDGSRCLKAHSRGGASILLNPFRFSPAAHPWLSWRWRVDQFVDGEALTTKEGSDASARIYVYFDTRGLAWQKRNLDYVWSSSLPVGTVMSSAYSSTSKILVVESGREARGQWHRVSRNIKDDYKRCFGQEPSQVVALGIMTDADNTKTEAIAYFDDLMVTRQPPPAQAFEGAPASND